MNTRLTLKQLLGASILALSLPLAAPAFAHQHDAKQGAHCQKGQYGQHHGKYYGQRHASKDGVPHYMRGLELSQVQKDQLFTLRHEQAPVMREQKKQRHDLMKALRDTTQAASFDDGKAQQIAADLANLEKNQVLTRARTQAKMMAVLTPEQRAKAQAYQEKRAEAHHTGYHSYGKSHHHRGDQKRNM